MYKHFKSFYVNSFKDFNPKRSTHGQTKTQAHRQNKNITLHAYAEGKCYTENGDANFRLDATRI